MHDGLLVTFAKLGEGSLHGGLADFPTLRGTGEIPQDEGDEFRLAAGIQHEGLKINALDQGHVLRLGGGLHLEPFGDHWHGERDGLHAALLLPADIKQAGTEAVGIAAGTQALRDKLGAHGAIEVVAQHLAHEPGTAGITALHRRNGEAATHQRGDAGGIAAVHHRLGEMHLVIGRAVEGLGIGGFGIGLLAGAGFVLPPAFPRLLIGGHLLEELAGIAAGGVHFIQRIAHLPIGKRFLRVNNGAEFSGRGHQERRGSQWHVNRIRRTLPQEQDHASASPRRSQARPAASTAAASAWHALPAAAAAAPATAAPRDTASRRTAA